MPISFSSRRPLSLTSWKNTPLTVEAGSMPALTPVRASPMAMSISAVTPISPTSAVTWLPPSSAGRSRVKP